MEEYREYVGEMTNKLVKLGIGSMGWRIGLLCREWMRQYFESHAKQFGLFPST